ncbi:hypothetical protein [Acidovorax sp. Leaf73]|uniref:hypothetical protein n=1 Tax=Acidovorax sp. Leaf73 TaxID=2876566 RepID=UPI001E567475|nr:hypothetical protein [Acidovorax sp. Leaf73]
MTKHTDLIERLRCFDRVTCNDAADALEAQVREMAELKAQLSATAKNAFEAMPHDILRRMKDAICEETGWSGSMVSRMYTELRKAFTGEPYKANEDLDAALLEIEGSRKDAGRYKFLRKCHWTDSPPTYVVTTLEGLKLNAMTYSDDRLDEVLDARVAANSTATQKGQP